MEKFQIGFGFGLLNKDERHSETLREGKNLEISEQISISMHKTNCFNDRHRTTPVTAVCYSWLMTSLLENFTRFWHSKQGIWDYVFEWRHDSLQDEGIVISHRWNILEIVNSYYVNFTYFLRFYLKNCMEHTKSYEKSLSIFPVILVLWKTLDKSVLYYTCNSCNTNLHRFFFNFYFTLFGKS